MDGCTMLFWLTWYRKLTCFQFVRQMWMYTSNGMGTVIWDHFLWGCRWGEGGWTPLYIVNPGFLVSFCTLCISLGGRQLPWIPPAPISELSIISLILTQELLQHETTCHIGIYGTGWVGTSQAVQQIIFTLHARAGQHSQWTVVKLRTYCWKVMTLHWAQLVM